MGKIKNAPLMCTTRLSIHTPAIFCTKQSSSVVFVCIEHVIDYTNTSIDYIFFSKVGPPEGDRSMTLAS